MGENAKKIGEKLEGFGERLYERFGWNELTRDEEIKCIKKTHRNDKGNHKRTHGIDLFHNYYDAYKRQKIGVITECKNYEWQSINEKSLEKWIEQLLSTIECAQISESLKEYNSKCTCINTGILLVHANDGKYNEEKFRDYVKKLKYKTRKNPINIFIASNKEIEKWDSMFSYIEKELKSDKGEFNFYYPSIMGSDLETLSHITLYQLFSSYIFAENKKQVKKEIFGSELITTEVEKIVFSFDEISENSLRYLCDMFKELQLEGANKYKLCFYPETIEDANLIDEKFKSLASEFLKGDKIEIIKLDNRNLSPVEIK
ncbi:TPA: hypothetical protein ACY4SJ_002565 [Clostridium perfringens]